MTIEIHKPELEALIMERLRSGGFESIEDVLMQALQGSSVPAKKETRTGADLIAAMQKSPFKEIDIVKAPAGRLLSESIALAEAHANEQGEEPTMDPEFAADLKEIIKSRKPRKLSQWD